MNYDRYSSQHETIDLTAAVGFSGRGSIDFEPPPSMKCFLPLSVDNVLKLKPLAKTFFLGVFFLFFSFINTDFQSFRRRGPKG